MQKSNIKMQNDKPKFKKKKCLRLIFNFYSVSLILVFYILIFLHLTSYIASAYNSSEVIKAIEVEGLNRIKKEELIDIIGLNVGENIDRDALKRGIKRAFKKGGFLDINVLSEPFQVGTDSTRDGVKLKYIVKEIPQINHISIAGNRFINERKIKKAFILKEGEDLKEELLKDAEASILNLYQRRGFPEAKVEVKIEKDKIPYKVNLNITVTEGSPLIIENISAPQDIKGLIKVREGNILDREMVEKEINRIKKYYKEQLGYIKPVVGPYEFKEGRLIIPAFLGQRLEIAFKENTVFSSKRLLKEMPFIEEEEVTDELIEDTINRIKRLYWNKGYNHVKVAGGVEIKDDLIKVTFFIFEGKRVIINEIRFEGITIPAKTLEAIIPIQVQKPFDESMLENSKESIIGLYNGLGYLSAEIKEIRKEFIKDNTVLNLVFVVYEGPQIKISKITVTGNQALSEDEIRKAMMLNETAPYNAVDIGDARYRILSLYNRHGYIDAHVEVESTIKGENAFVTFKLAEDKPSYIGKIIIHGNKKTKEKIIRREFAFKEGEPYNYEKLSKTRQQLYKLGLFTDISIEPFRATQLEIDKGYVKDLLVSLKEGKPGAVEIGVGYGDYEGFRGFFDINYRNLGGYNRQIGLRTELSQIERRHILSFKEPWFLNKPSLPLSVYLTKEDKKSINLDTREIMYKIDRTSLLVGIDKELTERLRANLNYEYSIIDTKDVKEAIILSKEDTGTLGISSISPSLFYDMRDNPFDPTAGSLNGVTVKLASKTLLSETEFVKATIQSAWFFKIQKGFVFAFSLRGGGAYGLGDTTELPLIERFFLGGRTTVRGYDQDTLGPMGIENTPTGGNAFVLANGEFRTSLGKGLGMVTFVDSGNVWKDTNDVDSNLRYTTGIGLRFNTPVGPFRFDYGYKLNRQPGESKGELHFSLGHAF